MGSESAEECHGPDSSHAHARRDASKSGTREFASKYADAEWYTGNAGAGYARPANGECNGDEIRTEGVLMEKICKLQVIDENSEVYGIHFRLPENFTAMTQEEIIHLYAWPAFKQLQFEAQARTAAHG